MEEEERKEGREWFIFSLAPVPPPSIHGKSKVKAPFHGDRSK
jgi:hypothetical protein